MTLILSGTSGLQTLSPGQYCESSSSYSFHISSVNITPWPPTLKSSLSISLEGSFTQESSLFGLSVESLYNEELDYTNFIDLDENYSSSKATTFSFNAPAGSLPGTYKLIFTLTTLFSGPVSCWEVSYTL